MNGGSVVVTLFQSSLLVSTIGGSTDFIWGTGTASYQIEGGVNAGNRSWSIWDTFCNTTNKVYNHENGDNADKSYYFYETDAQLLESLGVSHYRMSLSWSRILPDGETINEAGINHYKSVFDTLKKYGISPVVTLFHWDLPQCIYDITNGGWINSTIVDYYTKYAQTVFENFGEYSQYWATFNEPWTFCVNGYQDGVHAPGRCSNRTSCPNGGNSSTEPYLCAHNVLLSHASAVAIFRGEKTTTDKNSTSTSDHDGININNHNIKIKNNQTTAIASKNKKRDHPGKKRRGYNQDGSSKIGMNLNINGVYAANSSESCKDAVERNFIWNGAWFADPLYYGDYPQIMKEYVGSRLPTFTDEEKKSLSGSVDYFGLNHYNSNWVWQCINTLKEWSTDSETCTSAWNPYNGTEIGPVAASSWLHVYPRGIYDTTLWIHNRYFNDSSKYKDQSIFITENGFDSPNENQTSIVLNDTDRINYLENYIGYVMDAHNDGLNVNGYFVWSLMDNFEWADGYSKRFGIHAVDFTNENRTRTPRQSAVWYTNFIKTNPSS